MTTAFELAFVRREEEPVLAPPSRSAGAVAWLRDNLFSSVTNTILTLLGVALFFWIVPSFIRWAFIDATWTGSDREACATGTGACWAFVRAKFAQFMYGRYTIDQRWRVDLTAILLIAGVLPMAIPQVPFKRENAIYLLVVFPVWAYVLLIGGGAAYFLWLGFVVSAIAAALIAVLTVGSRARDQWVTAMLAFGLLAVGSAMALVSRFTTAAPVLIFGQFIDPFAGAIGAAAALAVLVAAISIVMPSGRNLLRPFSLIIGVGAALALPPFLLAWFGISLPHVETPVWGGLLVTLVVAIVGIVASLPLGVLLALGRRSKLPIVRFASVVFIEFVRGVPLITVLFMASVMLPLFLPAGVNFDKLLRALIGVALFSAAYLAEVVRGGLQAIPRGQFEAARAVGLGYWRMMQLIILPQALKIVIPGIVNSFISLFKDTSLVLIIGIFDLLGIVQQNFADANWAAPGIPATGYVFAAAVFWLFCFSMSRYSIYTERRLHTGYRR